MSNRRLMVSCAIAAVIGGCTMAPKYQRPDAPVPTTLPSGGAYGPAQTGVPANEIPWDQFFADAKLQALITQALENNRDLRLAALNVERAQSLYGVQRAELYPTVNAGAGMTRRRTPGGLTSSGNAVTSNTFSADLGVASWELDFFGRIRSLEHAALQQYLATEQARRSAHILLVSGVATTYMRLAADRENLHLAQTTLEAQQSSLDLVRRRFNRGIAQEIDIHRAQQQVDNARRDVASFTQNIAQDINALDLLVGAPVDREALPAELAGVVLPTELAPGTSSEILLSRPDIMQAEHQLMAANANIGAARAAFFPRISLTGAIGTASGELDGLFDASSRAWSFAPQIVMPIFDARVWAAKRVSEADQKIAVAQYERAIQSGFREVADALAVRGTVDEQLAAQESLVRSVVATFQLSTVRYERGLDSYLSVLDAQRSLYAAQRILVELRFAKLANQINLYQVLGGGWQSPQQQASATTRPSNSQG